MIALFLGAFLDRETVSVGCETDVDYEIWIILVEVLAN